MSTRGIVRSRWGRALVVACAMSFGRAEAQEATVPVAIRSASQSTELQIGRFLGGQATVAVDRHGNAVVLRDLCEPLCETPCTLQLPPGTAELCTSQLDVAPHHSADVAVPPTGADVSLRAFPGKPYVAGFNLWLGGSLVAAVGIGVLGAWGTGFASGDTARIVGASFTGVGAAMLATGIPIAVVYGREGVASLRPKATLSLGPGGIGGTF
jgi:hypothetical protein